MKKKFLTRLGVFALSAMVALSMGATVFADPSANPLTSGNSFTFEKDVKAINDAITSVDGPGVTFDYTIASVTPAAANGGESITDSAGHEAVVTAGPTGGLVFHNDVDSISYPKGTAMTAATSPGASNKKELTVDTVENAFKSGTPAVFQPGIYRYSISEAATPSTLPDGFTNTANQVRYVDVYVTTDGVSGIVMHDGTTANGAPAQKQTFEAASYATKNVCVKKVVAGAMADPDAEFAFTATVSNNGRHFVSGSTEAGAATQDGTTATLKNGQEFWICGLSTDATVGFSEVNEYGGNTYTATYSDGGQISGNGNAMTAANLADNTVVTFTNTLDSVNPTGVVMRFGAPILVLLAGLALVVINRRNKKATDVQ